ncbi:MAG: hypothetical protein AAGA71_11900 [Pseudomonadota bacterium]
MHAHFLLRRAVLAARQKPYGRIARSLMQAVRRAARRRRVLKEFQALLALPDDRLHEMGLARPQILAEQRQFRITGDIPRARP